ncbi:hypothetical protein PG996_005667 [Apiospora saccharicola]|uniref:Ribosomal protein/NADH dehydrogenase domain-containing protein n=1 Tax=Apiospora saccharicola TaxID=335842 RepID=A0ABR1VQY1_9PEZI
MSGKYAFAKSLKEVRFLFCQTGEHSAATRYGQSTIDDSARVGSPNPSPRKLRNGQLRRKRDDAPASETKLTRHVYRSFLLRAYPTMKKNNPQTPIMMREAAGTLPKVFARYEFGKETSQSLEGLSDKQIEDTVTTLVKNESAAS